MAIKINHSKVVTANDSASDAAAGRALKADWNADLLIDQSSFANDTDIANATDEYLLLKPSQIKQAIDDSGSTFTDRGNHTGTQAISTVIGLQTALDNKQATVTSASTQEIADGTVTDARLFSPAQIKAAAETHGGAGADNPATLTYNANGTVATSTDTVTGEITAYIYAAPLYPKRITSITKTLNGVTKTKTFTYNAAGQYVASSSWI